MLNDEKQKAEEATQSAIKQYTTSINQHLQEVSIMLLKGCFISNESYKKIRLIQSYMLEEERAIVLRCELPKEVKPFQKPLYIL